MTPLLAEEVLQSSSMDCGPAALKCLARAFGLRLDYDRLREVCRTQVDGTSIDALEDVAVSLGLDASQQMVPPDCIDAYLRTKRPFIAIVRTPYGGTHFDVVWNRLRNVVQLMDPGVGRRFVRAEAFGASLYVHHQRFPADAWLLLARESPLWAFLVTRLRRIGIGDAHTLVDQVVARDGWRGLSALDAAARVFERIRGGPRGTARRRFEQVYILAMRSLEARHQGPVAIPRELFFATADGFDPDGTEWVVLRGAVLLAVASARPQASAPAAHETLVEKVGRQPFRTLWRLVGPRMALPVAIGAGAALFSAAAALAEAVFFRASFSLVDQLRVPRQGAAFLALLAAFFVAFLAVDVVLATVRRFIGRFSATSLTVAILQKLPLLGDEYFRSRVISDLVQRAQSVDAVRDLPTYVFGILRSCADLALTTAAIAILDRALWPHALAALVLSLLVPVVASRTMLERDVRLLAHNTALSTLHLDALRGLVPMRMHDAERAMRVEHESLLVPWFGALRAQERLGMWTLSIRLLITTAIVVAIVLLHAGHGFEGQRLLLLFFWVQRLPAVGDRLATFLRQFNSVQAVLLRGEEPLRAEARLTRPSSEVSVPRAGGVALSFRNASVTAGGQTVLRDVTLDIRAGEHVAIVGPSGAGKSSLLGLVLGFLEHDGGEVIVDGEPLSEDLRARLRADITWVDPGVQLWNDSFLENLRYGSDPSRRPAVGDVIRRADLIDILERLPHGQKTRLGESGGLVSGGEGQRVRFGRALARGGARLVLLDEAFRGLDRERRRDLLARARETWAGATILCVTHDVADTHAFERVLVIEDGAVIEDEAPRTLLARPSRYRALAEADRAAREAIWSRAAWRHVRVAGGAVEEEAPSTERMTRGAA